MEEVYVIESSHSEANLISRLIRQINPDIQVRTMVSGNLNLEDLGKLSGRPKMVLVNLDRKGPKGADKSTIATIRNYLLDQAVYILAWTNPLSDKQGWDPILGRGSFEFKPLEADEYQNLIRQKLDGLNSGQHSWS